jgi:hypothetical protein
MAAMAFVELVNFDAKLRVEIYQNLMLTHALRHLDASDLNLNPK